MTYRYVSIGLGLCLTLLGLQLPGFVSQYELRATAHLAEVRANLAGFERVATEFFGGSLDALISSHRRNSEPSVRAEADVIAAMAARRDRFAAQVEGLQTDLVGRIGFVLTRSDAELRAETLSGYEPVINLDRDAAACGFAFLVTGIIMLDLVALMMRGLIGRLRQRRHGFS